MAGPYRNNVVISTASSHTFDPPLDAIYVVTAGDASGTLTVSIGGTDLGVTNSAHTFGTAGVLHEIGGITAINNTGNAFRFIGLRVRNKSGSSNVTNDVSG